MSIIQSCIRPIIRSPVRGVIPSESEPETGPAGYLLLETATDKLILEDGLGFLLLEGD